ncbi:uncharacterized protein HD556DRAFT_1304377 [Suillus plorans]|uniref:Uncharacterized protein n=1 Tax=Suillus plorans TaxID=116603 RepID=A0A9P7DSW9_9AGAM|nr:uncharacterized protein HD556DRAFT_1304377 [Suillus plorans]KAG1802219.1 hypothetical protein HD556DRAFT_1304377 [Suillus plorans]
MSKLLGFFCYLFLLVPWQQVARLNFVPRNIYEWTRPHPLLTITTANQQLDGQVEEIQALDTELADAHEKIATVRERIKVGTAEVEKLRSVRAEAEKAVEIGTGERVEDGRVAGLHDWCTTSSVLDHNLNLSCARFTSLCTYHGRVARHIGRTGAQFRYDSTTFRLSQAPDLPSARG